MQIGEIYRHIKTGGIYRICGKSLAVDFRPVDMEQVLLTFDNISNEVGFVCWRDYEKIELEKAHLLLSATVQAPTNGHTWSAFEWVLYQSLSDGQLWLRAEPEFMDGRFEKVKNYGVWRQT